MKRIFLALVILVGVSLTTLANTEILAFDDGDIKFPKELALTKDQKKQMEEIKADFGQKIKAVKMSRITEEMQQVKIKALKEEKLASIEKILTADQLTKFKEKKDKMGDKMLRKVKLGRNNNLRGATWMLAGVDLTDTQRDKFEAISKQYEAEKKQIEEKHMDAINNILTPEQQTTFKSNRESISKKRHSKMDTCPLHSDIASLSKEGKTKVDVLKDTYKKEKSAVERSRIAPEMQKQKLEILKDKLEKDIQEIIDGEKK